MILVFNLYSVGYLRVKLHNLYALILFHKNQKYFVPFHVDYHIALL